MRKGKGMWSRQWREEGKRHLEEPTCLPSLDGSLAPWSSLWVRRAAPDYQLEGPGPSSHSQSISSTKSGYPRS